MAEAPGRKGSSLAEQEKQAFNQGRRERRLSSSLHRARTAGLLCAKGSPSRRAVRAREGWTV